MAFKQFGAELYLRQRERLLERVGPRRQLRQRVIAGRFVNLNADPGHGQRRLESDHHSLTDSHYLTHTIIGSLTHWKKSEPSLELCQSFVG